METQWNSTTSVHNPTLGPEGFPLDALKKQRDDLFQALGAPWLDLLEWAQLQIEDLEEVKKRQIRILEETSQCKKIIPDQAIQNFIDPPKKAPESTSGNPKESLNPDVPRAPKRARTEEAQLHLQVRMLESSCSKVQGLKRSLKLWWKIQQQQALFSGWLGQPSKSTDENLI